MLNKTSVPHCHMVSSVICETLLQTSISWVYIPTGYTITHGHRQSKSFTLMAIVKQRGPLSTTMRVEPRNHTGCIAMKRETRVDNILRQSSANIVFRKTGTVETINYLSAVLSSGGSISADVVGKLVKAVGGKLNGIMFGIWTGTTHCEITMRHPDVA